MPEPLDSLGLVLVAALLLPGLALGLLDGFLSLIPKGEAVAGALPLLLTPALFATLALYRMARADGWRTLVVGTWADRASQVGAGLAVGLLAFISNGLLAHVSLRLFGAFFGSETAQTLFEGELQRTEPLVTGGTAQLVTVFILLAVVTPIAEELFFRGYVYRSLRHHWSVPVSIVLSALVFSGFHFYVVQAIPIFVAGLLFALLYERTGSLLAPMVAHGVVNAIVVVLLFVRG